MAEVTARQLSVPAIAARVPPEHSASADGTAPEAEETTGPAGWDSSPGTQNQPMDEDQPRRSSTGQTSTGETRIPRPNDVEVEAEEAGLAGGTTIAGMSRTYRNPNHAPCRLAPLEAFSDELAENGLAVQVQPHHQPECGRESTTVNAVVASRCCGYRQPPTAAELYDAMRRSSTTDRDRTVLTAWVMEATERDWMCSRNTGRILKDAYWLALRPRCLGHGLLVVAHRCANRLIRRAACP